MPSYATWKVGTITVPSSTGSMAITGLGGTPSAVFFFGTNWLTEDSVVTSSGTGVFRGMAAPKYDAPSTIINSGASVIPAGDAHHAASYPTNDYCIDMLDTSGGLSFLYVAGVTSFDADGFTLNWVAAASGGYKVVYVALFGVDNVGAFAGVTSGSFTPGWKAGASLLHGAWGGPDVGGSDRTQEFYGGGAYPGGSASGWFSAGMTVFTFPTSASAQYDLEYAQNTPDIRVAGGGHFTGPFLITSNIHAFPTGGSLHDFTFDGDSADGGMVVIWDDEDSQTGQFAPGTSQGDTATVSGLPFAPGLVLGYQLSDEPQGQGTGGRGAAGFSVVTTDFQWTATVDGVDRGAFQSFQRGVCDTVHNSNVHAGTVELTDDGFITTTEEDDVGPNGWLWHAFGHPTPGAWIPQIYRLVMFQGGGASTVTVTVTGYVLLEDGFRIMLEDGSGALLL